MKNPLASKLRDPSVTATLSQDDKIASMLFDVLTIFSKIINDYSAESILGRAQKAGLIKINAHNFREYTLDKHGHVDDRPYGGGPGMVLQIQPIYDCLKNIKALQPVIPAKAGTQLFLQRRLDPRLRGDDRTRIIALDPAGKKFDQKMAKKFSKLDRLVLVCGRYEGFDARVYKLCDERISVGDYVLSGGELPALTIIEAVSRLIPGVLGNEESLREETFSELKVHKVRKSIKSKEDFQLAAKWPQYSRPENFMGMKVPKVLLSGNHEEIKKWRTMLVKKEKS